jgi:hypothetical protein
MGEAIQDVKLKKKGKKKKIVVSLVSCGYPIVKNVRSPFSSLGHTNRIFAVSGILLVTQREYAQFLAFYWSSSPCHII